MERYVQRRENGLVLDEKFLPQALERLARCE